MSKEWQKIEVSDPIYSFETNTGEIIDLADGAAVVFNGRPSSPVSVQWRETRTGEVEVREIHEGVDEPEQQFTSALKPAEMRLLISRDSSRFTKMAVNGIKQNCTAALRALGYQVLPPLRSIGAPA